MTVYIEWVLIDNFFIDYLLFKFSFCLSGVKTSKKRLFLTCFIGALFSLTYPLMQVNLVLLTIIKVLFGIFLVGISAKFITLTQFYITLLIFLCSTFLFGGAVTGIFNLLNIKSTEFSIAILFIVVYIIYKPIYVVVKYAFRKKDIVDFIFPINIYILNQKICAQGFLDTGNNAYDGEDPVIFCNRKFFNKILKLADENMLKSAKYLYISTIHGGQKNLSIKLQKIEILKGDKPNIYNNVTMCVCNNVGINYQLILGPTFMGEDYAKKFNNQIKKIS